MEVKLPISIGVKEDSLFLKDRNNEPLGKDELEVICNLFNALLLDEKKDGEQAN